MKSFAVIPSELEDALADGMGFDGSCIEGFCRTQESDMLAYPDASTFQVLPWRPESNAVARMFCDVRTPDGLPFEGDPRQVLARTVGKAREMGYVFNVGPELEFYYFKEPEGTEVLDRGGYFDLTSLDYASDLRRDTVLTLEKMGIPVEYCHHENGPVAARDRPALHRRAVHGRRGDDVQAGGEGDSAEARRVRLVHAQAHGGRAGQRHARAPEPVRPRRQQRVLRPRATPRATACRTWRSAISRAS